MDTVSPSAGTYMVTPGYFDALSIPIVGGREFTPADTSATLLPVVVSAGFAQQVWPGRPPVGERFRMGGSDGVVVGVVSDVHHESLDRPAESAVYVPLDIFSRSAFSGFVRVAGSPLDYVTAVRAAVRALDPDLPISDLGPLTSQIESSVSQPRLFTSLVAMFGAAALLLASLGIYGVVAQGVARRRKEIGIRMVLGARAPAVTRMVVAGAVRATAIGSAIGMVVFLVASRLLQSQLFEVRATDPVLLALAGAVLLGTAWVAAWLPARRAASIDPIIALRSE